MPPGCRTPPAAQPPSAAGPPPAPPPPPPRPPADHRPQDRSPRAAVKRPPPLPPPAPCHCPLRCHAVNRAPLPAAAAQARVLAMEPTSAASRLMESPPRRHLPTLPPSLLLRDRQHHPSGPVAPSGYCAPCHPLPLSHLHPFAASLAPSPPPRHASRTRQSQPVGPCCAAHLEHLHLLLPALRAFLGLDRRVRRPAPSHQHRQSRALDLVHAAAPHQPPPPPSAAAAGQQRCLGGC